MAAAVNPEEPLGGGGRRGSGNLSLAPANEVKAVALSVKDTGDTSAAF